MDIRHFRYFLAVARQRNFTRAAEQLGIAPPTLSRQIQDMEKALGTRLFVRQQREVSLTEAGATLFWRPRPRCVSSSSPSAMHNVPDVARSAISSWVTWPRRCTRDCCRSRSGVRPRLP